MTEHPRLLLTADTVPGLRRVADLRRDIASGPVREIWLRVLARAEATLGRPPIQPGDDGLPGRPANMVRHRNPDYVVCHEAGQRLLRAALAHLLTGRAEFKADALVQMAALFDPQQWPDWIDQAHCSFGYEADLRTGMLSQSVGLSYDWLAPALSADERAWVIEGLDRRGIQPILRSLALDPWWMHDKNNWMTVILSGLGIAGMALDGEHPDAARIIAIAEEKIEGYLSIYGPEGEFNESVNYAGANRLPVDFFNMHRYWSRGRDNRLSRTPFPEMCHWVMHTTLPPGRVVSVGDCHPERPASNSYVAAVASAARNGVLQWFYRQYEEKTDDPYSLVTYDPTVPEVSPDAAAVPTFKAYGAQGRIVVSRSDWSPVAAACIVHAKAGREENHEHNDVGQLCIEGCGERLIIDPGSPSCYPADFFEDARWEYYNASIRGHNVLMFGGEEQRYPRKQRGAPLNNARLSGDIVHAEYFPGIGAAWVMDLSPAYADGQSVRRTVLHLYPGAVAVLDEAMLPVAKDISLRWHTVDRAEPDAAGSFKVRGQRACIAACISRLDAGGIALARMEQAYRAPYDRDRMGDPLEQRHESYVEAVMHGARCRVLTLFNVQDGCEPAAVWTPLGTGWSIGDVTLDLAPDRFELTSPRGSVYAPVLRFP